MLVVVQQLEVEGVQAAVGGVHQPGEHLVIAHRGVHQAAVHLADIAPIQRQAVQLTQADQAIGTIGELGVQRDQVLALLLVMQHLVEVADRVDLRIGRGDRLGQAQGVGVAEP